MQPFHVGLLQQLDVFQPVVFPEKLRRRQFRASGRRALSDVGIAELILLSASQGRHVLVRFPDRYTERALGTDVRGEDWIVVGPDKLDVVKRDEEDGDIGVRSI